jgi:hypothetical protein
MAERVMPVFVSAAGVTRSQSSSRPAAANTAASSPVSMPAVFVENDSVKPLSDEQAALTASLQQDFVDAIGGPDQDPADPSYLERWRNAVPESDQRFKALFGVQAFLEKERSANLFGDSATAE